MNRFFSLAESKFADYKLKCNHNKCHVMCQKIFVVAKQTRVTSFSRLARKLCCLNFDAPFLKEILHASLLNFKPSLLKEDSNNQIIRSQLIGLVVQSARVFKNMAV